MSTDWTTWELDDREDRLDRTIGWLLTALLVFMPLAFGVVEAWSEELVILLAGAMLICLFLKPIVAKRIRVTWTWTYIPIAIFIFVIVLQLIPLPLAAVRLISPNTVARKSELLSDLTNASEVLSSIIISFYAHATRHDLRLVLAVAAVFVVVLNVYRHPESIMRLLMTISLVGAGIAVFALVQNAIGNDKIYWFVSSPHGVAHSGPFVNHSHYAQFMNMSIGAALAVFLVRLREDFRHRPTTPDSIAEYLGSPEAKVTWALVAMIALGAASVFLAMSRGGVVSLLIAAAFTTLMLSLKRSMKGAGWIIAVLALGAFICVLYIGFDAVYDRLTTLRDMSRAEGGRWQIVKDISVAWARFPILGTGLGTHEVVYPMFDRSKIPALASHAENEYAQVAEETGIIGLVALLAFGVLVAVHYMRAVRNTRVSIGVATYGLGFGLVAILVHSLSDFGQHLPANAILTAIFCALLIRLSRFETDGDGEPDKPVPIRSRSAPFWAMALVAVCVAVIWGGGAANSARLAEKHWRNVVKAERDLMDRNWQGSNEEYAYLIRQAEDAVDYQPGNAKYRHWLNVYRWHVVSRTIDPNTGEIPAEALDFAERIAEEFNLVRTMCPTFGATWCVLGQLERSVLAREEEGARHIHTGVALAPCDSTTRLVAGELALHEGQTDIALDHLKRAVELDERWFRDVASLLIMQFDEPEAALEMAGEDVTRVNTVANILETSDESTEAATAVREKIVVLLEQQCQEPTASAWTFAWLAGMYRREGRRDEAIAFYRQALAKDYSRVDWRFNLARLLGEIGAIEEAIREAEHCLRLRPEHTRSKRLIERLSVDPRASR